MGGCRCSYRDCKVRSDGRTHLFHYPVFERVRCQNWLKNANKLDLLELTLGQLKNRVVCQYHFKDSMFMNAKKNKLKFEAVPTENGPYCEGKNNHHSEIIFEPESYTLSNNGNLLIDDKKTHYYQKYSDFLTKVQATSNAVTLDNEDKIIFDLDSTHLQEKYGVVLDKNVIETELLNSTSYKQLDDTNQQIATTTDYEKRDKIGDILPVDFEKKCTKNLNKNPTATRRNKKVTILENKEVDFKFLTAPSETEDIKLSKYIDSAQLMRDIKPLPTVIDLRIADVIPSKSVTNIRLTDIKPLQSVTDLQTTDVIPSQSVTNMQLSDVKPLQSISDSKITDVKQTITTSQDRVHDKPIKRITRAIKSAQQLVNNGNIESRLQQLENKLMSALNRNTQELREVRKLVEKNGNTHKASRSCSRSYGTQTKLSEEQEKRYHYNQLSRFLSNETKSVLYEALFLSKYDIETNTPKPKRRKCIL